MMTPWLSFIAALAGFGLISLTMERHAGAWSGHPDSRWRSRGGKTVLAASGAVALTGSCAVALHDNLQLGAVYWSGYLMAAVLLITGLHAYAERWIVPAVMLVSVALIVSIALVLGP